MSAQSDSLTDGQGLVMPEKVGKYEVHGLLGRGSSGVVYKGFDPFVRREVAIKTMRQGSEGHSVDPEAVQRAFYTEARAAGMLNHPHIVSLFDAGSVGELNYLVMEFIDGETLLQWTLKEGPRIAIDRVIDIAYKCAKALDYSHSKGVMHRDIKPSNIMLTRDGTPKLMDFSVAEVASQRPAGRRELAVGSPLYMSPEQVMRRPPEPTSDLYSLGVVMYQLLAGVPPSNGPDLVSLFGAIRNQPLPPLQEKRPELPHEVCAVVTQLLSKHPQDRYQSGGELANDLLRIYDRLRQADANITRRENRDSLRSLRFFDNFGDEDINEILGASQLQTFAPGTEIVREGDIDAAFYLIARGSAEVRKGKLVLDTLTKGDCFGEIAFLSAARRTATVAAITPVLALRVNSILMDRLSTDCQLRFYKTFTNTLIYRLTLTSAKLQAAKATQS